MEEVYNTHTTVRVFVLINTIIRVKFQLELTSITVQKLDLVTISIIYNNFHLNGASLKTWVRNIYLMDTVFRWKYGRSNYSFNIFTFKKLNNFSYKCYIREKLSR